MIEKGVEVAAKTAEGAAKVAVEFGKAALDVGKEVGKAGADIAKEVGKAGGEVVKEAGKVGGEIVKGGKEVAGNLIDHAVTTKEYNDHRHDVVTCNDLSKEKHMETIAKGQEYVLRQNRCDRFNKDECRR